MFDSPGGDVAAPGGASLVWRGGTTSVFCGVNELAQLFTGVNLFDGQPANTKTPCKRCRRSQGAMIVNPIVSMRQDRTENSGRVAAAPDAASNSEGTDHPGPPENRRGLGSGCLNRPRRRSVDLGISVLRLGILDADILLLAGSL